MIRTLSAVFLLLLALPAAAQATALHGSWRGTGEDNEGEILELRADGTAISDGDKLAWKWLRDGVIQLSFEGEAIDVPYTLAGDRLVLQIVGESYPFTRAGAPAGGPPQPNPLGGGTTPPNPLARPTDPFARRFVGDGIALTLTRGDDGYRGQLEFRGATYPVTATADGTSLRGTFRVDVQPFPFTAELSGDRLRLHSGGTDYALVGDAPVAAAPAPPPNPLAGGVASPATDAPAAGAAPPALEGVAPAGGGKTWQHPRGWFTFEMPAGWSVWQEVDDGILLNPGFGPQDTLDALIVLRHGRLEAGERGVPIDQLLTRHEAAMRRDLGAEGIQITAAAGPATKVSVGEVPGAVLEWKGRAQNGSVDVWCGALAKRDAYLGVIAVLADGKGARFLPQIKRVFQTLRPTPPEPNPALARALAGRRFGSSEIRDGNSLSATYDFRADGSVRRTTMFSGRDDGGTLGSVGGASEDDGTYEVVGDEVFLYFKGGQESAQVLVEGGAPTGLRFGQKVYRAR